MYHVLAAHLRGRLEHWEGESVKDAFQVTPSNNINNNSKDPWNCSTVSQEEAAEIDETFRPRTFIDEDQKTALESAYLAKQRPIRADIERLAGALGLYGKVIRVWFQNRLSEAAKKVRSATDLAQDTTTFAIPLA